MAACWRFSLRRYDFAGYNADAIRHAAMSLHMMMPPRRRFFFFFFAAADATARFMLLSDAAITRMRCERCACAQA